MAVSGKGVYHWAFGRSPQLLLNRFLDLRSRFIRKGCDREVEEVEKGWKKIIVKIAVH